MGRPSLGPAAMTPAERQARRRAFATAVAVTGHIMKNLMIGGPNIILRRPDQPLRDDEFNGDIIVLIGLGFEPGFVIEKPVRRSMFCFDRITTLDQAEAMLRTVLRCAPSAFLFPDDEVNRRVFDAVKSHCDWKSPDRMEKLPEALAAIKVDSTVKASIPT